MKQFGCFQLDTRNECLWQNGTRIGLTPKPFAVLRYLVENPQRLVTHDELLDKLWPKTYVQPQVLRTYVLELRKLLGDSAESPQFIRTVAGRGYWFLAQVEDGNVAPASAQAPTLGRIFGRQQEFDRLNGLLLQATRGDRQVAFVTGETGMGKTALIDLFCRRQCGEIQAQVARGQCVEGFAGKEAYYPVIEALGQLCPAVMPARGERMLNEICDAVESMSSDQTLVLVFEDLHWADLSTLDLLSALARPRSKVAVAGIVPACGSELGPTSAEAAQAGSG
jgi:DNA-binding winged helix-turn-helix (wHTH) protein